MAGNVLRAHTLRDVFSKCEFFFHTSLMPRSRGRCDTAGRIEAEQAQDTHHHLVAAPTHNLRNVHSPLGRKDSVVLWFRLEHRSMKADLKPILSDIRRGYEALYGDRLAGLVLFGSRARGDAEADSDIDVLVALVGPVEPSDEVARSGVLTSQLCLKHDVHISCIYVSEDQLRTERSPLLLNVRREGVRI